MYSGTVTEWKPTPKREIDCSDRMKVHIRWMIRRDMEEVLQIERESFESPWFDEEFIRCLRQRNCIGMVAENDELVRAFMVYELHRTYLHVLNFAVAPQCRRKGIGRQMVEKLIGKLSSQRRTSIRLEVRATNLDAQLFFSRHGFRATKVVEDFYDDSPEEAYSMIYRNHLPTAAAVVNSSTAPAQRRTI